VRVQTQTQSAAGRQEVESATAALTQHNIQPSPVDSIIYFNLSLPFTAVLLLTLSVILLRLRTDKPFHTTHLARTPSTPVRPLEYGTVRTK
jgi:hypothetical protein